MHRSSAQPMASRPGGRRLHRRNGHGAAHVEYEHIAPRRERRSVGAPRGRGGRRGRLGDPLHRPAGLRPGPGHRLRPGGNGAFAAHHRCVLDAGHVGRGAAEGALADDGVERPVHRWRRRHALHGHVGLPAAGDLELASGLCRRVLGRRSRLLGAGARAAAQGPRTISPPYSLGRVPRRSHLRASYRRHGRPDRQPGSCAGRTARTTAPCPL